MTENKKQEYLNMIENAKKELASNPDFDQFITVKTTNSNIYSFANKIEDPNNSYETEFVHSLVEKNDFEIEFAVCTWKDGSIDFPSMNFRKLLLNASEKNNQTNLILSGDNSIVEKTIISCMPN